MLNPKFPIAYLFERFPAFTQTFCFREVVEMMRQGAEPLVCSIRAGERSEFLPEFTGEIHYAPQSERLQKSFLLRWKIKRALKSRLPQKDFLRLFEAMYFGPILKKRGVRHIHTHFAGIGARTAFWIKRFYGIPYSFTGHANDIFCPAEFPVSLEDLIREAEFIATETIFSRDMLAKQFPAYAQKIHHVYNGISICEFPRAKSTAINTETAPLILSVGRCIEKKGFPDLIEACRILRDEGVLFRCEIIGDGPLRDALQTQIANHHLEDRVQLFGSLPQEKVRVRLAEARVFALPCVIEENGGMDNLPTVIMEAMAVGLPVVSTRLAGIPEMVVSEKTGFLVEPNQPVALVDAMKRLLQNPTLARQFGEAGHARAEEQFSIEITTRALRTLIEKSAGDCNPTR